MRALAACLCLAMAACAPLEEARVPAPDYGEPVASVSEAQAALASLGFRPGPIDGVAGSRTTRAVRAYRESRGLPRNGGIDEALSLSIRVESASAPGVPAQDPRLVERRWLPEEIREPLDAEWSESSAMLVDLDRDGDLDLVAQGQSVLSPCDGDLCPWLVFERTTGGWRKAGAFEARGVKLRRGRHNGWRDLSALLQAGAVILRYDGAYYR